MWWENAKVRTLWEEALSSNSYDTFLTPRTGGRGDGLMTAVQQEVFEVMDKRSCLFNDCGDRVAQALRLRERRSGSEMLLVNLHLLFAHNPNSTLIRLRECFKILEFLQTLKHETGISNIPILLAGDFNGSVSGQVSKFLLSQGFTSTYPSFNGGNADWVSHKNHHGEDVGVDHIWLLNPKDQLENLAADWRKAVYAMVIAKLEEQRILSDKEAFDFFDVGCDASIDDEEFFSAIKKLGLTGEGTIGLMREEARELITAMDLDASGTISFEEFEHALNVDSMAEAYSILKAKSGINEGRWGYAEWSTAMAAPACSVPNKADRAGDELVVTGSRLPEPCAKGKWDNSWTLSDHVPVTTTFEFVRASS